MSKILKVILFVSWALVANAESFKPVKNIEKFRRDLAKMEIEHEGKHFGARKFCNRYTIDNPDKLEVFSNDHKTYTLIILCPGGSNGDDNMVTVFSANGKAKTQIVEPESTSSRLSDEKLKEIVAELVK